MGSSKKRKEKDKKKKHKRDRSRSREREGRRRSHKSGQKDRERRRSRERYGREDDEPFSLEKRKHEESRYERDESGSPQSFKQEKYSQGAGVSSFKSDVNSDENSQDVSVPREDEEDFDIDELLDSKLSENPEFCEKKQSSRKFSAEDVVRSVERIACKKETSVFDYAASPDRSNDPTSSRYDYVPGLDLVNYGRDRNDSGMDTEDHAGIKNEKEELYGGERVPSKKEYDSDSPSNRENEPQEFETNDAGSDTAVDDGGQSHLSLSIAETNKLRAKLGLKPLDVSEQIPGLGDDEDSQTKSSESGKKKEVFVKTENIAELKAAEKLKEKIQTHREKRKILEKLGDLKPLGASDSEEEDSAAAWVIKSRKLQEEKEQAEKRARLLEEMDAEFGVGALVEEEFGAKKKEYSSKDLKGLVVAHDSSLIQEGQQVILTLKDKGVLDNDDDVLQNVNLIDQERYARNVENRKKKPVYQPYEEEYDEFGILKKKNILSKYDEEIEGEKKQSFTLGETVDGSTREREMELIRMRLQQQQKKLSLEMPNLKVANEYYTADDMVQFKKPKKKRKLKKLKADDLIPDNPEEDESHFGSRSKHRRVSREQETTNSEGTSEEPSGTLSEDKMDIDHNDVMDTNEDLSGVVVEEDQAEKELHSALNKARKLKQRKSLAAPEKVVVEVLKKVEDTEEDIITTKTGPIVLNSTAEFCRTLGDIPTYGMSGNRDEEADELMEFERELMEERQRQEMEAQNRGAWNEVNIDEERTEIKIRENEPILEEEPNISIGVAGALHLAQKKGYLDKDSKKQVSAPRVSNLQAQSYTIEEKFYDDDKFGKRDRYTGPIQDFREKNAYKPDVKLEYIDDNGRLLNAKEAFRYLSHKFHGKGPGKNKVDKRMKKLDQDTKLKQMSSTDTPLNTVKLLQAKQKEAQSPYIVLSGGSKALTQTIISKTKQT